MIRKKTFAQGDTSSLLRLLLLALFFFGGVLLGQVVLKQVPDETGAELERYLTAYMDLDSAKLRSLRTVFSTLGLYLRYPLLAFLLSFASIGTILLPCTALFFGFSLSFSVCCFTAAFGPHGALLALATFGIRCLVTLPCFFLLAVPALETSAILARASLGGRQPVQSLFNGIFWRRLGAALLALLAGMCVELLCSPYLVDTVLKQLMS